MRGTVKQLRRQAGNRRVTVDLDTGVSFGLTAALAARLRAGQLLADEEVAALVREDSFQMALDRALGLLAYRGRSCQEIDRYLQRKGVDSPIRNAVLTRLKELGLVDDELFTRHWVEGRRRSHPRSGRMLAQELRTRGVPDELIRRAVEGLDEEENAYSAARMQLRKLAALDEKTALEKLKGYLGRRGFNYSVVRAVLQRLTDEKGIER